ncbi:LOW QUALITY PROTEIN: uncharacterized protein Dere_GG27021 [Drosophila erecta]|nr:LOW QUALITY PROTEIN: uncharacterized protein Dere_GG27021 [Drosophila erecta]
MHFECTSNKTATNVIFKHKPKPKTQALQTNLPETINLLPRCLGGTNYPKGPKQILSHIFTWCSQRGVGPRVDHPTHL